MARDLGFIPAMSSPFYFLSYNSEDQKRVGEYAKYMAKHGLPIWYDKGIEIGTPSWEKSIADHIRDSECVIMFLSRGIFQKRESFVHKEFVMASQYFNKKIIVVFLDEIAKTEVPSQFVSWWIDVTNMQGIQAYEYSTVKGCVERLFEAIGYQENLRSAPTAARGSRVSLSTQTQRPVTGRGNRPEQPKKTSREELADILGAARRTQQPGEPAVPLPPPPLADAPARDYVAPTLDLLTEAAVHQSDDYQSEMAQTSEALLDALDSFGVRMQDKVDYVRGPSVTRYELRPEPGVTVRSVVSRVDDISLKMGAYVRLIAPIPGKAAIGIEVPNDTRETVHLRTMLESKAFCDSAKDSSKRLEVPLGVTVDGEVQLCNLKNMPHLLVAGSAGSGKSICLHSILLSLMYKTTPEELRMILIDPKMVEFSAYEHVPHLYIPVVTDAGLAVSALVGVVEEMNRRYGLLRDAGVRDLDSYNLTVKQSGAVLPRLLIVIDEYAFLRAAVNGAELENSIGQLAQKGRAAGIHVILCTQRPSVDVITGYLKSNIPSRISFKVASSIDSRVVLDAPGAEILSGCGDMLYQPVGTMKATRLQGTYVSYDEVDRVIRFVKEHNDPVRYNRAFLEEIRINYSAPSVAEPSTRDVGGGEDALLFEVMRFVIESERASASWLQRKFSVGYGRAAMLMNRLEELGIISPPEGNKPRRVLMSKKEFDAIMANQGSSEDEE